MSSDICVAVEGLTVAKEPAPTVRCNMLDKFERWYMGPYGMMVKIGFALCAVIVSYIVR